MACSIPKEDESNKKKNLAFKASSLRRMNDEKSDGSDDEEGDEELAMLTRRFKRLMKKGKSNKNFKRKSFNKNEEDKKEPPKCFK